MQKGLLLVALLGIALGIQERLHIATRDAHPSWDIVDGNHDSKDIRFTIFLKEQNIDKLQSIFEQVSNPDHTNYGKFLTKEQVDEITRPDEDAYIAIEEWLKPFANQMRVEKYANSIEVKTTARIASILFDAPIKLFKHRSSKRSLLRATGILTVPNTVRSHIDFVAGLTELFTGPIRSNIVPSEARAPQPSPTITPYLLKEYYNVPSTLTATNPSNLQAIAAFSDEFSMGALRQFEANFSLPNANVTRFGPDCLPENCDQFESDLDVQYITAMATGANTWFIAQGNEYWILQTVNELFNQLNPKPNVISFSYGWSELQQCQIGVENCAELGYNSEQYVNATDLVFMKLGTLGVSALVSDGDDGAASLGGASGNCPIDANRYCPIGGCAHTSTKCPAITITNGTGDCFFPNGIGSAGCQIVLSDPNFNQAFQAFAENQPTNCNFNLEQDLGMNYHIYSDCGCNKLVSTTSAGYTISGYTFAQQNGALFTADYPTSSPYVTSVGATQLVGDATTPVNQLTEIVASILTGSSITTGGGFSSFQAQPSYQSDAVAAWVSNANAPKPPSWSYNTQMRGYPDVAFCGHAYAIFVSNGTDECPCNLAGVDGTSASSPAFAGLVTLINDNLMNAGKSPLGFLNPLLYKMAGAQPDAFNNINSGDNKCNRAYCCQYGYTAVSNSWNPVTGLGSPNFGNMLSYISTVKGLKQ
eukprot:TRINITY_DN2260_c0_g2_i1.p1 TRINITY_DN2260_c0_g2~~TRINITY_DN2260_c0_g2_i1.p1  ORF type:complete len:703 (-),score=211.10 TRINITY_DN2260_c0_g2_i1:86-2194(-)